MNYLIVLLILFSIKINFNCGLKNDKISVLSMKTNNHTNVNISSVLSVLNTTISSIILNSSFNSSGNNNEPIINVDQAIAENVDKDLIIDNIYTISQNQNVELKCPIELNKQPNKEQISIQAFNDPAKVGEPIQEFYDYADEENIQNYYKGKERNTDFMVQWYKDTSKINKQFRFKQDGVYLRIEKVKLSDAGKYKCKLINGFGSVSTILTLNVLSGSQSKTQYLLTTSTKSSPLLEERIRKEDLTTLKTLDLGRLPVFINPERMQPVYLKKKIGSQIRFKCRASGMPRPDILWFKNGEILSEEDYGITRSKWTIDLKDLRLSDSGNYTCQVFNKHGFINSTYHLNIYDESKKLSESMEPLNITILVGGNAELNCKIKSKNKPNIKWMKQITKSEYANYIFQNNLSGDSSKIGEIVSELTQKPKEYQDEDEMLKSFYSASTLSPLSVVENINKLRSNTNFDENFFLSDIINRDLNEKSNKDEFNFELYVPNEKNIIINSGKEKNELTSLSNNIDGSIHYVTLSSSPLITQQISYDSEHNYYISKLTIKHVQVQDSGIYVCFGGDNTDAYNYRKSYLKVLLPNSNQISFEENNRNSVKNQLNSFIQQQEKRTENYFIENQNKNHLVIKNYPKETSNFLGDIFYSNSFLIVLIPILLIISFAIASIFYLKRIDDRKIKNSNSDFDQNIPSHRFNFFKCFYGERANIEKKIQINSKNSSINSYCCCPSSETNPHTLIQKFDESNTFSEKPRSLKNNKKLKANNTCVKSNILPCTTNSLGSTLSDSSTATTTTAAYYAAIPLLIENNVSSPPPPLPNSPPPTFSPSFSVNSKLNDSSLNYKFQTSNSYVQNSNLQRVISTPSMAYYKIVDCDLVDSNEFKMNGENQENKKIDFNVDHTGISTNSQFYYQLSTIDSK